MLDKILQEIKEERARQNEKWGEQNHTDSPMESVFMDIVDLSEDEYIPAVDASRRVCEEAAGSGNCTWSHIFLEEVLEVEDAARQGDVDELEEELIQVAAVAVQWVEAIRRRRRKE